MHHTRLARHIIVATTSRSGNIAVSGPGIVVASVSATTNRSTIACIRHATTQASKAKTAAPSVASTAAAPTIAEPKVSVTNVSVATTGTPSISYVTGAQLSKSTDLQAVSFFLTSEDLASLRTGNPDTIKIESLLGAPCKLFDGAGAFPSAIWQDFRAEAGETLWLYPAAAGVASSTKHSYPRLLLVGLGAANEVKLSSYRSAAWRSISAFQSLLLTKVGLILPTPPNEPSQRFFDSHFQNECVANVARIAVLSEHYFRKHLSEGMVEKKKKKAMAKIEFIELSPPVSGESAASASTTKGKKSASPSTQFTSTSFITDHARIVSTHANIARATIRARELANERGDVITPAFMEAEARSLAQEKHRNLKFTVLNDADLAKEGLHLLRAVGQAAKDKARLVVLEYRGASPAKSSTKGTKEKDEPFTALVGKGITFDTGGLLIKGRGNMEGMHLDMSGSAAVLATMSCLAELGVKRNVVGVLALAENAIGAEAYKPLAILPSAAGTVEIQDTDAEGRLALADALTYVQTKFSPCIVIDLATLTGASVVALGEHVASLFSNNDSLSSSLLSASESSGEKLWRMPILPEHADELKSTYADLKNCATHRYGGACIAASFLEKYISKSGVAWAHLDIAGPAMATKPKEWICEGGTGFGTQILLEYFLAAQEEAQAAELTKAGFSPEQVKEALARAVKEQEQE